MEQGAYAKETRNTVRRMRERGRYDYETVHDIVNKASILHVSFLPTDTSKDPPSKDPFPTILPMLGYMGSFDQAEDGSQDIYLHGHSASRMMKLMEGPSAEEEVEGGVPVCVAATILDGIKLSLAPFHNSCNYRSAVLHGRATIVSDEGEKDWALRLITDGLVPGCWENSREPTPAELKSTSVMKVVVVSASAKIARGMPSDERSDLKDDKLTSKTWTGVIPTHQHLGKAQPSPTNKVDHLPEYLARFTNETNTENETYATGASEKQ